MTRRCNARRIYGTLLLSSMAAMVCVGVKSVNKAAIVFLAAVLFSILCIFLGFWTSPIAHQPNVCMVNGTIYEQMRNASLCRNPAGMQTGFPGLKSSVFADNWHRHYVMAVEAGAAHIYTECARIWNPIHTDKAFALAAGLPDVILHGTATLAMAVSRLVNELLGGQPGRVNRIGGRFTGMVFMPTLLSLDVEWQSTTYIGFSITNEQGSVIFSQGFIGYV